MGTFWQDLRYATRLLLKAPGFAVVAVLTLALGIGANTAVFTVVNAVLLRPLALPDSNRLLFVRERLKSRQGWEGTASFPDLKDWRAQNTVFEGIAAYLRDGYNLSRQGNPERVPGASVTADYFDLMGARPVMGRTFLPGEDQPGHEHEVVLSTALWKRLGADPGTMGSNIVINGQEYAVVGVMPPDFRFPSATTEMWVPLVPDPKFSLERGNHSYFVVARLKKSVRLEAARAEMETIAARLEKLYPIDNKDRSVTLRPLQEQLSLGVRQDLLVLLGAVAFVFLIACANVVNLLLARAAARTREIAIRRALGAGRMRLLRHFLTESFLLAVLGGAAGWLLAVWGVDLLLAAQQTPLPTFTEIRPDARVFGFTLLLSLVTALGLGLATALKSSRLNVQETLKEGGRSATQGRERQRATKVLVVAEVAVTLILLTGAGLMLQTFARLRRVDTGIGGSQHILTMKMSLAEAKYSAANSSPAFLEPVMQRLEAIPGVQAAGAISLLPLQESWTNGNFLIEGRTPAPGAPEDAPEAELRGVNGNIYKALGIPVLSGRPLNAQDSKDAPLVAIINQALARRYFPDQDPIGKRIRVGDEKSPLYTIVGVVGDVHQGGAGVRVQPEIDVPFAQWPPTWPDLTRSFSLVVRADGDPQGLTNTIRQAILGVDPDQPVSLVKTMDQVMEESMAGRQFDAFFLSVFAGVALLLAAIGVYGVLSYGVRQRTHEIGVRMALGAQSRDVLRLVLGEGMALTAVGVALGIGGSLYLTRFLSTLLYGIETTDVTTYVTVALLLCGVVLLACYLPARRAMRVDPLVALRYE
jgi:putative ABC transport system permease protein